MKLLTKSKKIVYIGFRATLNFRKFKSFHGKLETLSTDDDDPEDDDRK